MNEHVIVRTEGLQKSYPGTVALAGVSLEFLTGEVHAIVGENGAGKSTLIKALSGALAPDAGKIVVDGKAYSALSSAQSLALGISVIYQEFMLVPDLSVAENIYLGRKAGSASAFFDKKAAASAARSLFDSLGIRLDPSARVRELSAAYQQLVEIAKAVSRDCRLLIMDEPTAPLTEDEVRVLYKIIADLKKRGVTIIYVSHRLDEIFAVSDRVSVLRDGAFVTTKNTSDTNPFELIRLMVGREFADVYPPRSRAEEPSMAVLEAVAISDGSFLHNLNLVLRRGEILGLGGLMGSGRTSAARALCGLDSIAAGQIRVRGAQAHISDPREAIRLGIGYIPEDRKTLGLLLDMSVKDNATLAALRSLSRWGIVRQGPQRRLAESYVEKLGIKTSSIDKKVKELSGGNQQKVVLAKWLATTCDILIFDEPTRGIDVGAKYDIYRLMNELVAAGKSILMITSEMNELLGMSDRIAVMHEGTVRAVLDKKDATQDTVLRIASGL